MKHAAFQYIWDIFKRWFLPQPSHDDHAPKPQNTADSNPTPASSSKDKGAKPEHSLESAEEMERRAARQTTPAPSPMNLHEVDLSGMTKPPEGSDDRASRAANPFSRSPSE